MYEDLVERLRTCGSSLSCNKCKWSPDCGGTGDVLRKAADAIEALSAKVDSLQIFADNISKLPDCNTCFKKEMCEFVPRYGAYCRINCPHWLGEPPKEET